MIPQEPFAIECDCPVCKSNTTHECEFQSWIVEKMDVYTLCTCLICENSMVLIFTEDQYEYLQMYVPQFYPN